METAALALGPATVDEQRRRRRGVESGPQDELSIPAFTPAGGTFSIDWDAAQRFAQQTLAQLDLGRRDIVLYAPGTGSTEMYQPLSDALRAAFAVAGRPFSVATLKYAASAEFRSSVPTGIAALRLVLAAIAAHPGDHRVTLVGISQGAWIGAEVLADPAVRPIVERAVLVARPSASRHRFDRGEDPSIIEFAHHDDFAVRPFKGDPTLMLDATISLLTKGIGGSLPLVARAIAQDPGLALSLVRLLALDAPLVGKLLRNPHDYEREMPAVAAYLAGVALGSVKPTRR